MKNKIRYNWSRSVRDKPKKYLKPLRLEAIQEAVQQARENDGILKVYGSGHSFNDIASSNGSYALDLCGYNKILKIDEDKQEILCQPGATLAQLNKALLEHQLAFPSLGTIDQQSIAGAIATGTHGGGLNFGLLSLQLLALDCIDGTGKMHHIKITAKISGQ